MAEIKKPKKDKAPRRKSSPDLEKLVKFYVEGGRKNIEKHAIAAGYATRTAKAAGWRALNSVKAKRLLTQYDTAIVIRSDVIWDRKEKLLKIQELVESCMFGSVELGMRDPKNAIAGLKEHNSMQGDNVPEAAGDKVATPINITIGVRDCSRNGE